mgnify:CR=1
LGFAEWGGQKSIARLQFANLSGQPGPYQLRGLRLFRQFSGIIDTFNPKNLAGVPDLAFAGPIQMGRRTPGMSPLDASILNFTHSVQD